MSDERQAFKRGDKVYFTDGRQAGDAVTVRRVYRGRFRGWAGFRKVLVSSRFEMFEVPPDQVWLR